MPASFADFEEESLESMIKAAERGEEVVEGDDFSIDEPPVAEVRPTYRIEDSGEEDELEEESTEAGTDSRQEEEHISFDEGRESNRKYAPEDPTVATTGQKEHMHDEPVSHHATAEKPRQGSFRPIVRKESEEIEDTRIKFRIRDVYVGLKPDLRAVVAQFVSGSNDVDMEDIALVVVKAQSAPEILLTTMSNLRESAQFEDKFKRAFFILRLNDEELKELGVLVSRFREDDLPNEADKLTLSEWLVDAIEELRESGIINYVAATESVLQAANSE